MIKWSEAAQFRQKLSEVQLFEKWLSEKKRESTLDNPER